MKQIPICPYCSTKSQLVTGKTIYPHLKHLAHLKIYQCAPCDAYVGCHKGSEVPLGRLANKELRDRKMAAHREFDPIWQDGHMIRADAYQWLADQLGIPKNHTHIGMFDLDMCNRVIAISYNYFNPKPPIIRRRAGCEDQRHEPSDVKPQKNDNQPTTIFH